MKCRICGINGARIRAGQEEIAKITGKAHVDCAGHSEYRCVLWCSSLLSASARRRDSSAVSSGRVGGHPPT